MKKIIISIFVFLSLIGYYLSFEYTKVVYDNSLALSAEQGKNSSTFIILRNEKDNNDALVLSTIISICKSNDLSVIKISPIDENHVDKYFYINNKNLFKYAGLTLSSKQIKEFNSDKDYLITNDHNKKADLYFPYFPSEQNFYIRNIIRSPNFDGRYQFIGKNAHKGVRELQHIFPKLDIDKLPNGSMKIQNNFMHIPKIIPFIQLSIMLIIIAIICMLMDFSQNQEKYSIKKMFGFSSLKLLFVENKKMVIQIFSFSILIYLICFMITLHQYNLFVGKLFQFLGIFLILEMIMLTIIILFAFIFFKKVEITSVLKHKTNLKYLLTVNFLLRLVIVVFGVSIIQINFQPLLRNMKDVANYSTFTKQAKGYFMPGNMQTFESDTGGYLTTLSDEMKKAGGIGVDINNYAIVDPTDIPFLVVNENFINHAKLLDVNNQIINIKQGDYQVIVPEDRMKVLDAFIPKYFPSQENLKVTKLKAGQKVFTFDSIMNEGGLGYAKNPIIYVSDFVNPWYIYLKGDQIDIHRYQKRLASEGYNTKFDMHNVNEESELLYFSRVRTLIQNILLVGVSFIALCLVIIQFVMAYMKAFKREIAIKKSLGFSIIKRYDTMLMLMSFFYLIVCCYCFLQERPFIEQVLVIIMFIFECILSFILIMKNEHKITAESLKE